LDSRPGKTSCCAAETDTKGVAWQFENRVTVSATANGFDASQAMSKMLVMTTMDKRVEKLTTSKSRSRWRNFNFFMVDAFARWMPRLETA
jgi:hypothetical protein